MVTDNSKVDDILKQLEELENTTISVGIIGKDEQYEDSGVSVAKVAEVHEFGFQGYDKNGRKMNIPERSFIRATYDSKQSEIEKKSREAIIRVVEEGESADSMLKLLGQWGEDITREYLIQLKHPPLKPETIKAKGSSNPLIDTTKLEKSISHEINKGG